MPFNELYMHFQSHIPYLKVLQQKQAPTDSNMLNSYFYPDKPDMSTEKSRFLGFLEFVNQGHLSTQTLCIAGSFVFGPPVRKLEADIGSFIKSANHVSEHRAV